MTPQKLTDLLLMIDEAVRELTLAKVTAKSVFARKTALFLLSHSGWVLRSPDAVEPLATAWYFVRAAALIVEQHDLKVPSLATLDQPKLFERDELKVGTEPSN